MSAPTSNRCDLTRAPMERSPGLDTHLEICTFSVQRDAGQVPAV